MNAPARKFEIKPAVREQVPLLVGLMGPPGAGKTYSALTLAEGMRQVAGGPPVLIDTEGGRSKKYADLFKFDRIDFAAPFRPTEILAAIHAAILAKPCAIIVDSMSDEHEGEGGVLDWHDAELDRMGGTDWAKRERVGQAAWIKPKADRRAMINGLLQIQVPMVFCFRAREKVKQIKDDRGKMVPTNIGYMPIAPSEIVHVMDLNCVLPPKSDGVPVWKSDKMGEDFIIKLPEFFKALFTDGQPITRATGHALASWARGGQTSPQPPAPQHGPAAADRGPAPPVHPASESGHEQDGAGQVPTAEEYVARWDTILLNAETHDDASQIAANWNEQKKLRNLIDWPDEQMFPQLRNRVTSKVLELKKIPA